MIASRRASWRRIVGLTAPVALQSMVMAFLGLTDQLMVGQLGDHAIGAAGIAGQLTSLVIFVVTGLVTGVSAFTAQFWAREDMASVRNTLWFSAKASFLIAVPVAVAGVAMPSLLMRPFTVDMALVDEGSTFVRLMAASFVPAAAVIAASGALRATGQMRLLLYASLTAVTINVILDWILIFGHFGVPKLGLAGAGVATLTARLIEAGLVLGAVARAIGWRRPGARPRPAVRRQIWATAIPLVANELAWILSENTYAAVYGHMGTSALVAMTMTYPLQNLVFGLFTGIAAAATPLIGSSLGHGQHSVAQADALRLLRLTLIASVVMAGLVAAGSRAYARLYPVSADVAPQAVACLLVFGALLLVKTQNKVLYDGVLTTGGDTRYFLVTGTLATWLLGVPLAFVAAFVLHWPIWLVYLTLSVEEMVRFVIGLRRIMSRRWMRLRVGDAAAAPGAEVSL